MDTSNSFSSFWLWMTARLGSGAEPAGGSPSSGRVPAVRVLSGRSIKGTRLLIPAPIFFLLATLLEQMNSAWFSVMCTDELESKTNVSLVF